MTSSGLIFLLRERRGKFCTHNHFYSLTPCDSNWTYCVKWVECPFQPVKRHKTLIIAVFCESKTYWGALSLPCGVVVSTPAWVGAADCGLFTPHLRWFVSRGENILIKAVRQRALSSLGLHLAEPWSSSTEVDSWQHPGARQTSRESCLMKLTARSLCPTTTVHGLHEIKLSWCLLVCRSVGGHIAGMSNSIAIQDYNFTLLPQTHPDQILEFPLNNLLSSY